MREQERIVETIEPLSERLHAPVLLGRTVFDQAHVSGRRLPSLSARPRLLLLQELLVLALQVLRQHDAPHLECVMLVAEPRFLLPVG